MTNAQDIINNTAKNSIKHTPSMAPLPNPETGHLHIHKMVSRNANGGLFQCECGEMCQIDFAMGY